MRYFRAATEAPVGAAGLVGASEGEVSAGPPAGPACDELVNSIDTMPTTVQ